MKQSKTPLWKKSILADLSYDAITEWLEEIGENGDPCGYEDSEIEGYYNDYKEQFDELSAGAWAMYEELTDYSYYSDDYDSFQAVWNDMTVGLLGDLYTVYGYDAAQLDYTKIFDIEAEWAVQECEKRLMRMTKQDLIKNFRKVLTILTMFFDLKAAHDCLTSIVEELDEKGALLEQKNERINLLYKDLTGKNAEAFDSEIANLPQRMWVE